jgi:hypothetical protein
MDQTVFAERDVSLTKTQVKTKALALILSVYTSLQRRAIQLLPVIHRSRIFI